MSNSRISFKSIIQVIVLIAVIVISFITIKSGLREVNAQGKLIVEKTYIGMECIQNSEFNEAEEFFKESLEIKESVEANIGLATTLIMQGKYQEAEKFVSELVLRNQKTPEYFAILGHLKKIEDDYISAKEMFEKAKKLDKKNGETYQEIINIMKNSGNRDRVRAEEEIKDYIISLTRNIIEKFEEENPEQVELLKVIREWEEKMAINDVYTISEEYEKLDDKYKKDQRFIKIYVNTCFITDREEEAIEFLNKLMEDNKNDEIHQWLSEAYIIKYSKELQYNSKIDDKRYQEIINQIKETLRPIRNTIYAAEKMAKINFLLGKIDETELQMEKLINLAKKHKDDSIKKLYMMAEGAKYSSGNNDEAVEINRKAFEEINKVLLNEYINNVRNRSWNSYFENYFLYRDKRISILNINTEAFPIISIRLRGDDKKFEEKNLKEKDLVIYDNGKRIKDFKLIYEENKRRNIILLMDTSGSMEGERLQVSKKAAENFVNNMGLQEKIMFAVFDSSVNILTDFLGSNEKEEIIRQIGTAVAEGGTNIFESIDECLDRIDTNQNNVVILMSDGADSNPENITRTIEKSQSLGVPIFTIGLDAGYEQLQKLSKETGGKFMVASQQEQLKDLYMNTREEFKKEYEVKYTAKDIDSEERTVKIEYPKKKLTGIKLYNKPNNNENNLNMHKARGAAANKIILIKNLGDEAEVDIRIDKDIEFDQVYLNKIPIDKKKWKRDGETLTLIIPEEAGTGAYDIELWKSGITRVCMEKSIVINEANEYHEFSIGAIKISGHVKQEDIIDAWVNGRYIINNHTFVGYLCLTGDILYCNGKLITKIKDRDTLLFDGDFTIDIGSGTASFDVENRTLIGNYIMNFSELQLLGDKIIARGRVTLRENLFERYEFYEDMWIRSSEISNRGIDLECEDLGFNYEYDYLEIYSQVGKFENNKCSGTGRIKINNPFNSDGYNQVELNEADYSIEFKDDYTRDLETVRMRGEYSKGINVYNTGLQMRVNEVELKNANSDFRYVTYKGDITYGMNDKLKRFQGTCHIKSVPGGRITGEIDINNEKTKINIITDNIGYDAVFGKAILNIEDDAIKVVDAKGSVLLTKNSLYGEFSGTVDGKTGIDFTFSDNVIRYTDENGKKVEIVIGDKNYINELRNELAANGDDEFYLKDEIEEGVVEITMSGSSAGDIYLENEKGEIFDEKTFKKFGWSYKKDGNRIKINSRYMIPGLWKVKRTTNTSGYIETQVYKRVQPPNIKINEVKSFVNRMDFTWNLKYSSDAEIDIYCYNDEISDAMILESDISSMDNQNNISIEIPKYVQPGVYKVFATINDGINSSVCDFYNEEVEIFKDGLPEIPEIEKSNKTRELIILEFKDGIEEDFYGYRIIPKDEQGKDLVDRIYVKRSDYDIATNKRLILFAKSSDGIKYFSVAVIGADGNQSPESEIIDVESIKISDELMKVKWNPSSENIGSNRVGVDVKLNEDTMYIIKCNGEVKVDDSEEAGKYEFLVQEGVNEIVMIGHNDETVQINQKVYVVDTLAPILFLEDMKERTVYDKSYSIGGRTESGAKIFIDEEEVEVDKDGGFAKAIELKRGKNVIQVISKDSAGNESIISIKINYKRDISNFIILGFGILYFVTIMIFIILFMKNKSKRKNQ